MRSALFRNMPIGIRLGLGFALLLIVTAVVGVFAIESVNSMARLTDNWGTSDIGTNIEAVSHAATDTGSAASQVLSAAGELSKQSETLRGEVDRFLATIRAA
jgi:methyl-accepting chemotaxis protein